MQTYVKHLNNCPFLFANKDQNEFNLNISSNNNEYFTQVREIRVCA
jgi:hypothetical protein